MASSGQLIHTAAAGNATHDFMIGQLILKPEWLIPLAGTVTLYPVIR
jgi:hypothetical protein